VETISARALNRATLARQMLLERVDRSALDAIEHLVGMQAQAPNPPYFGLWSRLNGFHPDELVGLIEQRQVVRIAAMRSTVHLMSAADALTMRALVQPVHERMLRSSPFGKELTTVGAARLVELVEAGRALVDEAPLTGSQLSTMLAERWPTLQPLTIQNAIRTYLTLVQVPPRGLWGRSGQATLTTIETWLGQSLDAAPSVDQMVLRYLAAFGPATAADVQAWSGLTRLGEVMSRLAPTLQTFRTESGATVFDLPDAPRPDADTPAPVRLIAEFDNLTLSYADRTRVLSDEDRRRSSTINGIVPGMVLVDGVVRGTWKLRQTGSEATLAIDLFHRIPADSHQSLTAEGRALLAFAAPSLRPDVTINQG
jgi:hypothetical protein